MRGSEKGENILTQHPNRKTGHLFRSFNFSSSSPGPKRDPCLPATRPTARRDVPRARKCVGECESMWECVEVCGSV